MKVYKVALYERLSREDGDNEESESISNQRDYLMKFIDNHDDLIFTYEYVDDGYSGGNFERPGWKQLMEDAKKKKIDTIITKDLSRMGRDYIQMGNYIEKIFPENDIRYIAVNDDIDTVYETPGLDYLQFKLMFNDFYIKDGSKKIRKIMKLKKEQGQYTGWKGIYGYKRDPNNKHKLIVDEEVRDIVVRMFHLVCLGYSSKKIADLFSREGIPNPSTYANLVRATKTKTSSLWCSRTIDELLQNPTYIGHLTQGRRRKVSYKSKKEKRVPKEEWIIVKNTHEPIIDEGTFNTVQDLMKKNKNSTQEKNTYLLKGFLRCKECGHSIGVNTSSDKRRRYCVCCYYVSHSKIGVCTPHSMNYERLENAVLDELKKICNKYIDDTDFENKVEEVRKRTDIRTKIIKQINSIDLKITQTINNIDNLYLDKLNGTITLEQHNRLVLKLKQELENLDIKKQKIVLELENLGSSDSKKEKLALRIKEFLSLKEPSRELLANLIDVINISEDKTVEINYKFRSL